MGNRGREGAFVLKYKPRGLVGGGGMTTFGEKVLAGILKVMGDVRLTRNKTSRELVWNQPEAADQPELLKNRSTSFS